MSAPVAELLDYSRIRAWSDATVVLGQVAGPTVVLGSRQGDDVVVPERGELIVRRRRGGGGAVLLRPGDLWVDFWLPATDARYHDDLHATARLVGGWWRDALHGLVDDSFALYEGPLRGAPENLVACFAGVGDGEITRRERKVVGVTQWRVREGAYVSTVMLARSSEALVDYLCAPPDGLAAALDHDSLTSLHLDTRVDELREGVLARGGSWRRESVELRH